MITPPPTPPRSPRPWNRPKWNKYTTKPRKAAGQSDPCALPELQLRYKAYYRLGLRTRSKSVSSRFKIFLERLRFTILEEIDVLVKKHNVRNKSYSDAEKWQALMLDCINLRQWPRFIRRRFTDRQHALHWSTLHALESLVRGQIESKVKTSSAKSKGAKRPRKKQWQSQYKFNLDKDILAIDIEVHEAENGGEVLGEVCMLLFAHELF